MEAAASLHDGDVGSDRIRRTASRTLGVEQVKSDIVNRLSTRAKYITFSLIPLLVVGTILHVTAGVVTYREVRFEPDSLTGVTVYRTRIGRYPGGHRSRTQLNTRGFPDREYTALPPKGACYHVVLAGDSFTFGDMTDGELTWASLLRDRVAAIHREGCVRFFNVAAPVTTIEEQSRRVRETIDILEPDLVLLGQYQNDITDLTNFGSVAYVPATDSAATTNWGLRLRAAIPGYDSPFPRMLTYLAFKFFLETGTKVDVLNRWSVLADSSNIAYASKLTGLYETFYVGLLQELRARKVRFGVIIMPSKMDIMAHRYPEGAFFEGLARKHDVPFYSTDAVLDANRRPMPYYTYDGHFNERGNRIVADAVYRWLFVEEQNPFGELRQAAGQALAPTYVPRFPK